MPVKHNNQMVFSLDQALSGMRKMATKKDSELLFNKPSQNPEVKKEL